MDNKVLIIPVKDLWDTIIKETGNNPYVYEDSEYLKDHYPQLYVLKELMEKYKQ